MAEHTVTPRTLLDGDYNTIIRIDIAGNGSVATEVNKRRVYDASEYFNPTIEQKIRWIEYEFDDFVVILEFEGSTDELAITLDDSEHRQIDEGYIGGISNSHVAGRNGDVLLTTKGLASSTKKGYILLHMQHRAIKDGTR